MNFLDSTRQKPLSERKRLVWIWSIVSLVVIVVAWLTFFNEWRLPSLDISQSTDLKEIVDEAKESTSLLQEQISTLQETTEEIKESAADQAQAENENTSFTKKNVRVSLLSWRQEDSHELVTVELKNLSDQTVHFENFTLNQGYREITAPLTETLEPQQKKEMTIDFLLPEDAPATAFEIKKTFFNADDSWNYLFALAPAAPENPPTPESPDAPALTSETEAPTESNPAAANETSPEVTE